MRIIFLQIFKNVLFPQLFFLYHSGMILQQQQPQQVIITTTGQIPLQQPQQLCEMNKVDYAQLPQPLVSQQPMVNQGSIMMYSPAITQGAYPPSNNPQSAYLENSQAVPQSYS